MILSSVKTCLSKIYSFHSLSFGREIFIKIFECAFRNDILLTFEALSTIQNLYHLYFTNEYPPNLVNEQYEGIGSLKQLLRTVVQKISMHIIKKKFY